MRISKYLKYIPWILVILAVGAVAFFQWRSAVSARELLTAKNSELMQANLALGRAQTKIVDQAALHKTAMAEINRQWKDEIKKRQALVTSYTTLEAKYTAEKKKVKLVTKIKYRDREVDLKKGKLWTRLDDGTYDEVTSIPFDYSDHRIDIKGDAYNRWISYKLHQTFAMQLVETKLPTGARNHYATLWELGPTGKRLEKLKLAYFKVLRADESEPHMMWWNPKLDLAIGLGINTDVEFSWVGELGLSASGYGNTPDDLKWRFFRLGAGVTGNGFSLTFSPVQFNLGKHLPLISNMWLTPYGGYDFGSSAGHFGLGVSVTL